MIFTSIWKKGAGYCAFVDRKEGIKAFTSSRREITRLGSANNKRRQTHKLGIYNFA